MLFVGLAALGLLIVGLSELSIWVQRWQVERKKEENYHRRAHYQERYGNTTQSNRNAVAARLHSIANQFDTYKEQQKRQERKRTTREIITLIVIGFTAFFAFGSDWIFYLQLDEMRTDRRAWVGPVLAGFPNGLPAVGTAATAVVQYHNTGKEPAIDVFSDLTPHVVTLEEDNRGIARNHISEYVKKCRMTPPVIGNQVVFPTTGFASYTVGRIIDGILNDWNVLYGTSLIFLTGCHVYNTLGITHRTSFCFYFQNGPKMTPQSWVFCPTGNHAD